MLYEALRFPEASQLYVHKLVAERCLLALARHQANESLEPADKAALREMGRMLSELSNIDDRPILASLSPDIADDIEMIVDILLTTRLVSSLPELRKYVQELCLTVSRAATGEKVSRKSTNRAADFMRKLSASVSMQLSVATKNAVSLACPNPQ